MVAWRSLMPDGRGRRKVLVVNDEWNSAIVRTARRRLEDEGWSTHVIAPESGRLTADEFEAEALYAVEVERPDGVLLDVRFGEYGDERFKGLDILRKIVERYPKLPVLMFTQYAQGPDRETAIRGTLKWDAPVDFIDKLADTEEVVLRLRHLFGTTPEIIEIGGRISLHSQARAVYVSDGDESKHVREISGMRFEILRELATMWYRSPGELVPFSKLEHSSEDADARPILRVRIRDIKDSMGDALGVRFEAGDFIVSVRNQGYRLVPPKA